MSDFVGTLPDLETIRKRMDAYDKMPPPYRELIQEFGNGIGVEFYRAGVPAKQARHLINLVLNGSYEIRERRNATRVTSFASERLAKTMHQLGVPGSAQALVEGFRRNGGLMIGATPSNAMVEASMNALPRRNFTTWIAKDFKHRLRLSDALAVAEKEEMGDASGG